MTVGQHVRSVTLDLLDNFSVASVRRWCSKPRMIPIRLMAPPSMCSIELAVDLFPDLTVRDAGTYLMAFRNNAQFFDELNKNLVEKGHKKKFCTGWKEFIYLAVRVSRPRVMFETGVFDGESSAAALQAFNDNGEGILVSIDLPAFDVIKESTHLMRERTLPPKCSSGWAIPGWLTERHRLVLGDSKHLLGKLLEEYHEIDIFLHDSLHTFEHQYFEYSTAWKYLIGGGLLLSDDIYWSPAFHKFCKSQGETYLRIGSFGALKKKDAL